MIGVMFPMGYVPGRIGYVGQGPCILIVHWMLGDNYGLAGYPTNIHAFAIDGGRPGSLRMFRRVPHFVVSKCRSL